MPIGYGTQKNILSTELQSNAENSRSKADVLEVSNQVVTSAMYSYKKM